MDIINWSMINEGWLLKSKILIVIIMLDEVINNTHHHSMLGYLFNNQIHIAITSYNQIGNIEYPLPLDQEMMQTSFG